MTGISREKAAAAVGRMFGTEPYSIQSYSSWCVKDPDGKVWKFSYDSSIRCQRQHHGRCLDADSDYATEMVSPKLEYSEMGKLQEVVRCVKNAGAYNKAKEEYRWNQWKAEEEKILREQGVDEETIQKLREYDWDDFNAERRFREHQTSLLDCMELLLEEKETKESQPESVEALLDTEEYTEAYY